MLDLNLGNNLENEASGKTEVVALGTMRSADGPFLLMRMPAPALARAKSTERERRPYFPQLHRACSVFPSASHETLLWTVVTFFQQPRMYFF